MPRERLTTIACTEVVRLLKTPSIVPVGLAWSASEETPRKKPAHTKTTASRERMEEREERRK